MKKRTERDQGTQAENGAGPGLAHLVEPMLVGMTTTREHLLAWVHAQGLAALDELFREEAVVLAGPKGRHQTPRTHHHWGTTATELTFGGRRVQVRRPRVRETTGGESTLPSVAAFRSRDPLTARMMQQLLAGVPLVTSMIKPNRCPGKPGPIYGGHPDDHQAQAAGEHVFPAGLLGLRRREGRLAPAAPVAKISEGAPSQVYEEAPPSPPSRC